MGCGHRWRWQLPALAASCLAVAVLWGANRPDKQTSAVPTHSRDKITVSVLSDSHAYIEGSWFRRTVAAGSVDGAVLGRFAAYPGASVGTIAEHAGEVEGSDWVILQGGTNDLLGGADPDAVLADLQTLVADLTAERSRVVVALVPPSDDRPADAERLNELIEQWVEQEGLPVLDVYTVVAAPDGSWLDGLSDDGVHANESGSLLMAETAARQLERIIG